MTLLITVFAAIISTIVWYIKETECNLKLGTLCVLYWGASIMWFVDAIFEYAELKADYFSPEKTYLRRVAPNLQNKYPNKRNRGSPERWARCKDIASP